MREHRWHRRSDDELLEEAHREGRIVLTHDRDFGTLVLLGRRPVVGIVRIRAGHIRAQVTIEALDRLLALDLDPSPPFLVVVSSGVGSIARSTNANERPFKLLFAAARQPGNQNGHQTT